MESIALSSYPRGIKFDLAPKNAKPDKYLVHVSASHLINFCKSPAVKFCFNISTAGSSNTSDTSWAQLVKIIRQTAQNFNIFFNQKPVVNK